MRDFLDFLFDKRGGFVESRYWRPGGPVLRQWYRTQSGFEDLIRDSRVRDNTGHEVYVGVLPRLVDGKGDAEHVSPYTDLLWADVDANDHEGSKRKALDAVLDFPVSPQVIVDSGRGIHAYWRLDRSYLFDDVQPIMRGIAQRIGGDAVHDRARILRLPGLSNHKDGGNAPVRLLRFDTTSSFLLSDLREYAYREPAQAPVKDWYQFDRPRPTDRAGDHLDLDHDPGKGARSEHDFGVVCRLIEAGWSDSAIVRAFEDHPHGVGAKFAKAGYRYLDRTIRKAHIAVGL